MSRVKLSSNIHIYY